MSRQAHFCLPKYWTTYASFKTTVPELLYLPEPVPSGISQISFPIAFIMFILGNLTWNSLMFELDCYSTRNVLEQVMFLGRTLQKNANTQDLLAYMYTTTDVCTPSESLSVIMTRQGIEPTSVRTSLARAIGIFYCLNCKRQLF